MASLIEWKVPQSVQPRAEDYSYDLERALSSVVGLHSIVPPDAFTADTLGVERAGNGVLVDDGLVLTIGYLITEAETVWVHLGDGRVVQGHALGFDQETGFGLVQTLGKIDLPVLERGSSSSAEIGERIIVGGAGRRTRSLAGRIAAKQEFAGYWEYVLEEAIFTYPAHPNWGGTALISSEGKLIGIGSLQLERARNGKNEHLNMIVPIDDLKPILEDLLIGAVEARIDEALGAAGALACHAFEEAFTGGRILEHEGRGKEDRRLQRAFAQSRVEPIAHHQRRRIELMIADMGILVLGAAALGHGKFSLERALDPDAGAR